MLKINTVFSYEGCVFLYLACDCHCKTRLNFVGDPVVRGVL